jgi:hypothetical protein
MLAARLATIAARLTSSWSSARFSSRSHYACRCCRCSSGLYRKIGETELARHDAILLSLTPINCAVVPSCAGRLLVLSDSKVQPRDRTTTSGVVILWGKLHLRCEANGTRSVGSSPRPPPTNATGEFHRDVERSRGAARRRHTSKRCMEYLESLEAERLVAVQQTTRPFQGASNRCRERRTGTLRECLESAARNYRDALHTFSDLVLDGKIPERT